MGNLNLDDTLGFLIVPTLRVGTQLLTLRVRLRTVTPVLPAIQDIAGAAPKLGTRVMPKYEALDQ